MPPETAYNTRCHESKDLCGFPFSLPPVLKPACRQAGMEKGNHNNVKVIKDKSANISSNI